MELIVFYLRKGTTMPETNKPFIFCYNDDDGYICVAGTDAYQCISHQINHDLLDKAMVKFENRYLSGYTVNDEKYEEYLVTRAEGQGD